MRAMASGTGKLRSRCVASNAMTAAPAAARASISSSLGVMMRRSGAGRWRLMRPMTGRSVAAATARTLASLSIRRPRAPEPATASAVARTISTVSSGEPGTGWQETIRPPRTWRSSASRVQAGMGLRRRGCAAEPRAKGRSAQASSRRAAGRGGAGGDKERAREHGGGRDPAHDPAAVLDQLQRHATLLRLVVETPVRAVVTRDGVEEVVLPVGGDALVRHLAPVAEGGEVAVQQARDDLVGDDRLD